MTSKTNPAYSIEYSTIPPNISWFAELQICCETEDTGTLDQYFESPF